MAAQARKFKLFRNLNAKIAALPMIFTTMVVFVGGTIWTVIYSFTDSKLLPRENFVGFAQYTRLWENDSWNASIHNLLFFGSFSMIFTISMGFLLAVLMDQKIRFELGSQPLEAAVSTPYESIEQFKWRLLHRLRVHDSGPDCCHALFAKFRGAL